MKKRLINNKGITLSTLVIAIIMMTIMTSMLVYNTMDGIDIKKYNSMCNDIELLNNKILSYYSKYGDIPAEIEYCTKEQLQTMIGASNINVNDDDIYYVIDLSAIDGLTLTYGEDYESNKNTYNNTARDVYIINKQSGQIYYPKGIRLDGVLYYTNGKVDNVEINL